LPTNPGPPLLVQEGPRFPVTVDWPSATAVSAELPLARMPALALLTTSERITFTWTSPLGTVDVAATPEPELLWITLSATVAARTAWNDWFGILLPSKNIPWMLLL